MSDKLKDIMNGTVDNIKSMANVDTIIGDPVDLGDGIKAIPVSKVSYGFASGGSDIPSAKAKDIFGGGGGAGVTVSPVAFLIVQNGNVKIMSVDSHPTSLDKAMELIPDLFDRVASLAKKKKEGESGSDSNDQKSDNSAE